MVVMSEGNEDVVISPLALSLIARHSRTYRTAQVHGILLGKWQDGKGQVLDAIPVCHEAPTKTLVESALALYLSINQLDCSASNVIGWYTVPELIGDQMTCPAAQKVVASMGNISDKTILVTFSKNGVDNFSLSYDKLDKNTLRAFGKGLGMTWNQELRVAISEETTVMKELITSMENENPCDLVDHWRFPASNEWPITKRNERSRNA